MAEPPESGQTRIDLHNVKEQFFFFFPREENLKRELAGFHGKQGKVLTATVECQTDRVSYPRLPFARSMKLSLVCVFSSKRKHWILAIFLVFDRSPFN